jgi:hypothetical protein
VNYTELVTAIQDTVEDRGTAFVAQIPNFVKMAEREIFHAAQLPAAEDTDTGTLTGSNRFLSTPDDYLSPLSLAVIVSGRHSFLLHKDKSFLREACPDAAALGVPRFYAVFDENTFELAPTPQLAYTVELHYLAYPPSIVTAGTTWIGDNFEQALLYGSLLHAYIFAKGEEDVLKAYDSKFKDALAAVKQTSDVRVRRDTYRSGAPRA